MSANPATKAYGDPPPPLTYTATGFVNVAGVIVIHASTNVLTAGPDPPGPWFCPGFVLRDNDAPDTVSVTDAFPVTCPGFAPPCLALNGFDFDEANGPYTWNPNAQGLSFGGTFLADDLNGSTLPVTWNTANLTANNNAAQANKPQVTITTSRGTQPAQPTDRTQTPRPPQQQQAQPQGR